MEVDPAVTSTPTPRRLRTTVSWLLESLPRPSRRHRWVCNLLALALLAAGLTFIGLTLSFDQLLGVQGIYALVLSAGSWAILTPVADPSVPLAPFEIAGLVMFNEVLLVLLVTGNFRSLFRVPWLGQRLRRLAARSMIFARREPRFQRYAFVGVALFVIIPCPGTGSVTGCILASLLGLSAPVAAAAVLAGCAFENFVLASFTGTIVAALGELRSTAWYDVVRVAIVLTMIVGLSLVARRVSRLMTAPTPLS